MSQNVTKMAKIEIFTYSSMANTIMAKFKSLVDLHANLFTKIGQIRESRESGLTCHKPSHGMKLLLQTCKLISRKIELSQLLRVRFPGQLLTLDIVVGNVLVDQGHEGAVNEFFFVFSKQMFLGDGMD